MGHHHHHLERSAKNLKIVFFLNLFFTVIELTGGIYTNSIAILSDALHDFGDSIALGLAWYLQNLAQKDRDKDYSYGYGRFSLLGSFITSTVLLIGSVFILQESIPRLLQPEQPHASGMIWIAILGLLVNGAAVFQLKGSTGLNERTAMLHLLEDVFGWVIVLIGAIIMLFFDFPIIDPLLSLILAVVILVGVVKSLLKIFKIFMQGIPAGVDMDKIVALIENKPPVKRVSDIHVWSTDGEYNVMTLNIDLQEATDSNSIIDEIKNDLKEENIHHVTIETTLLS